MRLRYYWEVDDSWMSAEEIAERLNLHVRTVRGYIRDGRLPATKVGKQYRISAAAFAEFTGVPRPSSAQRHVEASVIVQIEAIAPDAMHRLATVVTAAANTGTGPALRMQVIYDEPRRALKLILVGAPADTAALLHLIAEVEGQL